MEFFVNNLFWFGVGIVIFGMFCGLLVSIKGYGAEKGRWLSFIHVVGLGLMTTDISALSTLFGFENTWLEIIIQIILFMTAMGALIEAVKKRPLSPKSWKDKCLKKIQNLSSASLVDSEAYYKALENIINSEDKVNEDPEFSVAYAATCHLHKIAKSKNPQDVFLGEKVKIDDNDHKLNKITIKICKATLPKAGGEMRAGMIDSLELISAKKND